MITVGMNCEVRDGKCNAFERSFALIMEAMAPVGLRRDVSNDLSRIS